MDLEHEKRITEIESRAKSNTRRIDEMEKRQDDLDELVGTVKALAVKEERVETDVREIKNDVKSLANKPGQRWESFINKVILTVVGAVVGYMLLKMGF